MDTAIVYCSQTGHTQKYALWLAEELGIAAAPFAERKTVGAYPIPDDVWPQSDVDAVLDRAFPPERYRAHLEPVIAHLQRL